ncbi:MAG: malto-oligosyltrehalose synthase [Alphaproteobacteria bacterium]|nr:malto-oligosyltrehalose synthase [Alphaproteobacteria bacterium]
MGKGAADPPRATYRLQFNKRFTFRDATRIVPYLRDLGVSHVYASPILAARAGSMHGYDIVDHNALNPELGSEAEFDALVAALHRHGLGLILDFVPNHMGIGLADNQIWLDILEYGQTSPFAHYLDIEWQPAKREMRNKVLVPILGDHYGEILRKGELALRLDTESGRFGVDYHGHFLPLRPRSYAVLLQHLLSLAGNAESCGRFREPLDRLRAAYGSPPGRRASLAVRRTGRDRAEALKKELAALARSSESFREFVAAGLRAYGGPPGSAGNCLLLHRMLEAQAYRLAYWRVAAHEINYRRFFDINDLAGIRVELADVFEATHARVLAWARDGVIDGLRIDHIDGLYDPAGYCRRLRDRVREERQGGGPFYIIVEKILAHHERLPEDWPVSGTTGYDFLNQLNGLFVDPAGERPLVRAYQRFTGERAAFDEVLDRSKRRLMDHELVSELNVLANAFDRIAEANWSTRDYTREALLFAIREVVARFTVYRTYVTGRQCAAADRRYIEWAVRQAKKQTVIPDPSIFDFIEGLLTGDLVRRSRSGFPRAAAVRAAMKFQQYTGPMMAKSLEDTSFYRYVPLLSLNEVGGDPRRFGTTPAAFDYMNQDRLRHWPAAMLATSTHDTKRGEDVRARLNVLSELPREWEAVLRHWARLNKRHKTQLDDGEAPDRIDEYLVYQAMVGSWPMELLDDAGDPGAMARFAARVEGYAMKAVREAKRVSSWTNPNPDYEKALGAFVAASLDAGRPNPFFDAALPFIRRIARLGLINSLAQLTLKLCVPGVPDTYQGAELWDLSLVDPDNRRPVDYALRRAAAGRIDDGGGRTESMLQSWKTGEVKLHVLRSLLRARRENPMLFRQGSYVPLAVEEDAEGRVLAFARVWEGTALVVVAPRFVSSLGDGRAPPLGSAWGERAVVVPDALKQCRFRNLLATGDIAVAPCSGQPRLRVAEVLARFPTAVLLGR